MDKDVVATLYKNKHETSVGTPFTDLSSHLLIHSVIQQLFTVCPSRAQYLERQHSMAFESMDLSQAAWVRNPGLQHIIFMTLDTILDLLVP